MADVARLAGVSSQTVSRVSNGYPGVTEETRRQVLAAMEELGYRPNSAARALKRGEFRTIGVITFGLATTGNVRTLEAIATSAAHEGYAVTLLPVAVPTQDEVRGAFSRLGELAVDAVIVIMEVHLLDAVTLSLPPHVAGRRGRLGRRRPLHRGRHRPGGRQPDRRASPAGPRPPDGLASGRARGVVRGGAARRGLAHRAHRGRPSRSPSCTGRLVGRVRATGPGSNSPGRRTARRSSPPTTRWRSGCCGRCTSRAGRCRTTSASSASTTSPRPAPSCLP